MAKTSTRKYEKVELFSAGSCSVNVYKPMMRALSVLEAKYGFDYVYSRLADGDWNTIAGWLMDCGGYDGPDSRDELADEIMANSLANIEVSHYESTFRVVVDGNRVPTCACISGDAAIIRMEVAEMLANEVEKLATGSCFAERVYRYAIDMCRSGHYKAAFGVGSKTKRKAEQPAIPDLIVEETEPAPFQPAQPAPQIIRERVVVKEKEPVLEGLIREVMAKAIVDMNLDDVREGISKRLREEFGFEPIRHVVQVANIEHEVGGIVHNKFQTVLHYVANDIPIYLYGEAGSGKNVLCEQVAEALGMDFHFMNSVTDEFKISGFIDAYGKYHETEFYKAFKNGGIFFLDELDASAPEVLVCLNAAIANRYFAFPNGKVEAHPDFRVIAAGNTLGTGADASYTGRMQLDAASLNRFVVVEVEYDRNIDMLCAGNDEQLVKFICEFRKVTKDIGLPVVASYRNISQLRVAQEAIPLEECLRQCLCKEMNQDDINIVHERMKGLRGNRYYDAFGNVKAIVG